MDGESSEDDDEDTSETEIPAKKPVTKKASATRKAPATKKAPAAKKAHHLIKARCTGFNTTKPRILLQSKLGTGIDSLPYESSRWYVDMASKFRVGQRLSSEALRVYSDGLT